MIMIIISISYQTIPSTIWPIFTKFLIFSNLFHEPSGEETIVNIAPDKLVLAFIIYQSEQKKHIQTNHYKQKPIALNLCGVMC